VKLRLLKIIIPLLFLSFLGKACSLKSYEYCKIAIGKKCEIAAAHGLAQDTQDEIPKFRRKYKAKGIQEVLPTVNQLSFSQFHTKRQHLLFKVEDVLILSLHYVKATRGPPSI
jgi:hypothetical protein